MTNNITWYETNMTSNNTPEPLVVSAKSHWGNYLAYKAFDGDTAGLSYWHNASGSNPIGQWIALDFGEPKSVNAIRIYPHNSGYSPNKFTIE